MNATPLRIVISGASSGIGEALTRALASDGHSLFICARRSDRLVSIAQNAARTAWHVCDVRKETDVQEFAAWLNEKTTAIDVLINCAGKYGAIGPTVETKSDEWRDAIETNLFGTYFMIKALVPLLRRGKHPRIINVAGGGAFNPLPNYSAYAVSKAAIVRLTETLAVELDPLGIRVNSLAPGFVATEIHQATFEAGPGLAGSEMYDMTQRKLREGSVSLDLITSCVSFLLSEKSHLLTGKTISASFDPWSTASFHDRIGEINQSELYTMRRMNLIHLAGEDGLKSELSPPGQKS